MSTMRLFRFTILAAPTIIESHALASNLTCGGSFTAITAADFVKNLNPGWNLGNTLDAIPTEGSWDPPVVETIFDKVKSAGFKGVRIPVTWADHFISDAPDYTVNTTWLQRVSDVVDMVTKRGLYTIVNVHHDATIWADTTAAGANVTLIEEKFYRLWYQIGTELGCKSSLLAFEPINEPACSTADNGTEINKLNQIFLQAINDAGGYNSDRVVTLVGCNEDSVMTSEWFVAPTGFSNPYAIQFHYYSPYNFIFGAWGQTIWGSDADKLALNTDFKLIRQNFTEIPLVIGEYNAAPSTCEPAAQLKYYDYFVQSAREYDISHIIWDTGDYLDRTSEDWHNSVAISVIGEGTKGTNNSLPDSSEDSTATSQWTSAYIFHKRGDPVTDETLPWLWNGNTLEAIIASDGKRLAPGTDYDVSGANITFKESFLSTYISSTSSPGIATNLTLTFSAGASPIIQLVQWDIPTLSLTSTAASSVTSGANLNIPIKYAGLPKVAAVRAVNASGTPMFDSWTIYLGPLFQGRATYGSQWDYDASNVIIDSSALSTILSAGQDTIFTFEFYPRDGGVVNGVNFTVTA